MEVGRFIPFVGWKDAQDPNKETIDPFARIVEIANAAAKISHDNKDKKPERRVKAAQTLLEHLKLNPQITSDPKSFQKINDKTHTRVLDTLFKLIPFDKDGFDKFMRSEDQSIIRLYVQRFVENSADILGLNPKDDNLKDRIASHLKTYASMPQHYAKAIGLTASLPREPLLIKIGNFQRNVNPR